MLRELVPFLTFLSLLWFLVYWILGGVFFALVAIARLGRVRRVTFSCLFTLLALACGFGAAWGGMKLAQHDVNRCLQIAETRAEAISAVFGCGFVGVFGAFMLGAAVLVFGGFLIMAVSSTKEPIISLNLNPEEPEGKEADRSNANVTPPHQELS
jgi:hypothetical protein